MSKTIPSHPSRLAVAVGAALSLTAVPAAAAPDQVGRVLAASGVVIASGGEGATRTLNRDSRVYEGETIKTPRGRAQIRFTDGGLVSLRQGTRFKVEEYDTGESPESGEDDDGASVVMRLFEGAMRTITGAVGDDADEQYRMETPVATVGIRGTQYALQYCGGDACGEQAEGLYGQVIDSRVTVDNEAGSGSFGKGRYFQVEASDTPPRAILQPPGEVLSSGEPSQPDEATEGGGGGEGGDDGSGSGGSQETTLSGSSSTDTTTDDADTVSETTSDDSDYSATDETVSETVSLSVLEGAQLALGLAGKISENGSEFPFGFIFQCPSTSVCEAQVDSDDNFRLLRFPEGSFSIDATSDVTLAESGAVESLDATWGRWAGAITLSDGTNEFDVDGGLGWAYTRNPTTQPEREAAFSSGMTVNYDNASGPSPIGTKDGADWAVTNLAITMKFTSGDTRAVIGESDAVLEITDGAETINLDNGANTTDFDASKPGFFVGIDGGGSDTGQLHGSFAGDNAEGLLVDFLVENFDTGVLDERIRGVKILER